MYYGRGYERGMGMAYGRGMGFGFRGASPPWPYVGIGRGGLPRCWAYGGYGVPAGVNVPGPYPPPGGPGVAGWGPAGVPYYSREEELRFLKTQAERIREELEAISRRISELEKEKSAGGET